MYILLVEYQIDHPMYSWSQTFNGIEYRIFSVLSQYDLWVSQKRVTASVNSASAFLLKKDPHVNPFWAKTL